MSTYSETTHLSPNVVNDAADYAIVFVALVHEAPAVVWYDESEVFSFYYYYGFITLQGSVTDDDTLALDFENITPAPDGLLELLGF